MPRETEMAAPVSFSVLIAPLREHFGLDQPHVSVGVKQVWLLVLRSRANLKPWIFGVFGVEQDKPESEHLAQGVEACDFIIRCLVGNHQIDLMTEEAVRTCLSEDRDELVDVRLDLRGNNFYWCLNDIATLGLAFADHVGGSPLVADS